MQSGAEIHQNLDRIKIYIIRISVIQLAGTYITVPNQYPERKPFGFVSDW